MLAGFIVERADDDAHEMHPLRLMVGDGIELPELSGNQRECASTLST